MRTKLRLTLTAGLCLLSSCTQQIIIHDGEFCGSLGGQGAQCYHLLTNESRHMNLNEFSKWWVDTKTPKVATTVKTITDLKAEIEKLCSQGNFCQSETYGKVNALVQKISRQKGED